MNEFTGDRQAGAMRRQPQQARAYATIADLKQAALQVIARDGLPACRTDTVAARAGVSIGTVYKYFPNREAIFRALYEDASLSYAQRVGTLTLQILDLPTEQGMTLTFRNVVPLHREHRQLLLSLPDELPALRLHEQPLSFHQLVRNHIRAYIQHRNPGLASADIQRRAFFVERTVFGCIEGYLKSPEPDMGFEDFTGDLARLIAAIIDPPSPSRVGTARQGAARRRLLRRAAL